MSSVGRLIEANPDLDLVADDLVSGVAVEDLELGEGDGPEALEALRALQRLVRIRAASQDEVDADPEPGWARHLIEHGITSAHEVADMPEQRFVAEYGDAFESHAAAIRFHGAALARRAYVRHVWANVRDLVASPHYRSTRFASVDPGLDDYFKQIPSYQDLFGTLDYIRVDACASILGPAAYFADLMRIADEYVTDPNSQTIPSGYRLDQRRPGLFSLHLTCENTDRAQPILTLVNRVLVDVIADRSKRDGYELLATSPYPFNLPFNRPLCEVRTQVDEIGTSLDAIYAELGVAQPAVAREYLRLSIEQYQNLVTASKTPEAVAPLYGLTTLDLAAIAHVDAFTARTGLSREDLSSLLTQDLDASELKAGIAEDFFINATDESLPAMRIVTDASNPQSPYDKIANLSVRRLDRLSRFIRLQRTVGWSYADLDWMLRSVGARELKAGLPEIAAVQRLRARSGLAPDVLASLWHDMKSIGKGGAAAPSDLFDHVFNNPQLLRGADPYAAGSKVPFDPDRPIDWDPWGTDPADAGVRSRLTGALALSDNDLTLAAEYVLCLNNASEPLKTDLANLTTLFRLTRTAQYAELRLIDYFDLLRLLYGNGTACADRPTPGDPLTVADAARQLDAIDWLRGSGFTVAELVWIVTGRQRPDSNLGFALDTIAPFLAGLAKVSEPARLTRSSFEFVDIDTERSAAIFDALVTDEVMSGAGIVLDTSADPGAVPRLFPITDVTFAGGGITDAESKAAFRLLADHVPSVIVLPNPQATSGELSPAFDSKTDISYVFPTDEEKRDRVRLALLTVRSYIDHTAEVLRLAGELQSGAALEGLAAFVGADVAMTNALLPFVGVRVGLPGVVEALLTPGATAEVVAKVFDLVSGLARALTLTRALGLTVEDVQAVIAHPKAFGFDPSRPSLDAVRSLSAFRALVLAFRDTTGALVAFLTSDEPRDKRLLQLAALAGWDPGQLTTLVERFWPSSSTDFGTVAGVERLKRVFDTSRRSGLSLQSMLTLTALSNLPVVKNGGFDPAAWAIYEAAARTTLDAVNARFGQQEFPTAAARIDETVSTQSRDALVSTALWQLAALGLEQPSDLYQYLLIDVEASDCDAVSPIAQGIASVQLFLQRARMRIEPGVEKVPLPAEWWPWIESYRVWEANRKVFLNPENYIDPTLRRSRTPTFAALQDALLQSEVTDATVTTAYRAYLAQLQVLAQLRIVGTYRCDVPDEAGRTTDTLFVIARTNRSPGMYYWRSAKGYTIAPKTGGGFKATADWSPWQKLDITIVSDSVAPVWAFGRLMVYWAERHSVVQTTIANQQSEEYTAWTAQLRFSFLDIDGRWAEPQALGRPTTVSFEPDPYIVQAGMGTAFDPDRLVWRRPYVVHVRAGSWATDPTFDNAEQLLVLFGASIGFGPGLPVIDPGDPPATAFDAEKELNEEIHSNALTRKAVYQRTAGSLPVRPATAEAVNLLTSQFDCVLLNTAPNWSDYPLPYTGRIENSGSTHRLTVEAYEYGPLVTDWQCDQRFASAREALAPAFNGSASVAPLALLATVAPTNTAMTTVHNQIGWFVFDNGDDTLLVTSQQPGLSPITKNLRFFRSLTAYPTGDWAYAYTLPVTNTYSGLDEIQFAISRLGTHAVDELSRSLLLGGLDALLSPASQRAKELSLARLSPNANNVIDTTTDTLDFSGAFGQYFWELFFHGPFLVAERLRAAGRFADARRWFQFIFDPTASEEGLGSPTDQYWRFLPFRDVKLETLLEALTDVQQIAAYNDDPFDPDAIARLRPGAYPKSVVMRYIDNLVAWADSLFARDTRESITLATNLYVLAADLLGPRPREAGTFAPPAPKSYADLRDAYDTTGRARGGTTTTITLAATASQVDEYYSGLTVTIVAGTGAPQRRTIGSYVGQSRIATVTAPWTTPPDGTSDYRIVGIPQFLIDLENAHQGQLSGALAGAPFNDIHAYFGVPDNSTLIGYWDTIDDRLYKIRHCMNIQGVERVLAQYEPPLDPRDLVRQAAGNGGFTVSPSPEPSVPFYRFPTMLDKAKQLAWALSGLGASLSAAWERADFEELTLLSLTHERQLYTLTTQIRQAQIDDVRANREALLASRAAADTRSKYYRGLLDVGLSAAEIANLTAMAGSLVMSSLATVANTASAIGFAVPQLGSPFAMTYGGVQLGSIVQATAGGLQGTADALTWVAQVCQIVSGYQRRAQEWELQAELADRDLEQIDRQLDSSALQEQISLRNYEILVRSIAQTDELEAFHRRKFSGRELAQWMANRLSTIYFQTYTLAMEIARAAERSFQYELNTTDTFISLDYRDPQHRGLLAGEGLSLSLNQMEAAYTARDVRALEIFKTVSLLELDPRALLDLRDQGQCTFQLPELLFDQDYPGHYARKIKYVMVSLAGVPDTEIRATLTQLSSQVLIRPDLAAVKYLLGIQGQGGFDASTLRNSWWVNQQVALSAPTKDPGFTYSLFDARYYPFEGTGAVSSWNLAIPQPANRIDVSAILDVTLTLAYTARDGGQKFRGDVQALKPVKTYTACKAFAASQDFAGEWEAFLAAHDDPLAQTLSFPIADDLDPRGADEVVGLFVQLIADVDAASVNPYLALTLPAGAPTPVIVGDSNAGLAVLTSKTYQGTWALSFDLSATPAVLKRDGFIDPGVLRDMLLVVYYTGPLAWKP